MTSAAHSTFLENRADVDRLMELHEHVGGKAAGRRYGLEVLNRSAIVLLCATWEAYCEDIVTEVTEHYVKHLNDPLQLPKSLRSAIAQELTIDPMMGWKLAGAGWRNELRARLATLEEQRNRALNTPKTKPISKMLEQHVGYTDIQQTWTWRRRSVQESCDTLDRMVTMRGNIAHRVTHDRSVQKGTVRYYVDFIGRLVAKTDEALIGLAARVTGVPVGVPKVP